ncbi:MAG TPA: rRNA maturation RNase YbeY [Bacillota bacterium]|nr:rRNA maturation RNase YbeY [Candidatus Fermentithermobacillaceae bacterium]HOB29819.1 rRNA maturation RNase YbeY [Bacillota bacterium]HOK64965.1 rRNA maturation RNase YbeY [Bacillota bacterium]HOL12543.1 rRNA maturation RNase YbeY [Bacillota bacterium]HOQ02679.1 rRNA maturation RNase YbeY [Bacillota bacterium]
MPIEVDIIFHPEMGSEEKRFLVSLARRVVKFTLEEEGWREKDAEVSVLFTDDDFIADLNQQYRGEAIPTDVLAFPMLDFDSDEEKIIIPGMPTILGDIVISLDAASRQAEANNVPLRQELALLLTHGTLHLLGYDHDNPQKEAIMWERQDQILKKLNI